MLICIAALAVSGLALFLIVIGFLRSPTTTQDPSSAAEDVLAAQPPQAPAVQQPANRGLRMTRQPLQLSSQDCQSIVQTGVIWRADAITSTSDDIMYFGSVYLVSDTEASGDEIMIYLTLYQQGVQASVGDIILLNCLVEGDVTLIGDGAIKHFINLDASGDLSDGMSKLTIQGGNIYKLTYLGTVDDQATVGVQIALADNED